MLHDSIKNSYRTGIFTHINADGDALGSSFGLIGWLDSIDKDYRLFLPSEVSESLRFIIPDDHLDRIIYWNSKDKETISREVSSCDLLIGLDFNTMERIGDFASLFLSSKARKILIDHHIGPQVEYFDEVYSCTETSSCCELLFNLLKEMPEIDSKAGRLNRLCRESLLTGMTTDTNNFANSVYPGTLLMASELLAAGTDRDAIIQKLYFNYPLRRIKAMGHIFNNLMRVTDNGVGFFVLDWETQDKFKLQEGDTEGFVNIPLSIKGVRMSIFLKEEKNRKKVRVSIRSKKGTSARECSMRYFHGGGHELASGGKLIIGEDIDNIADGAEYIEKCTAEFFSEL